MADILLIHGAWHGGWAWRHVASDLRARGHGVFTPTLTGLGERAHLLTPDTGVEQHARDIMAVLDAEELTDVTLVCHSYAALPGSLATAHRHVARLVLLDSVRHAAGESLLTGAPPEVVEGARAMCVTLNGAPAMPPWPAATFDVPEGPLADWVDRRTTPLPWRCLADELPPLPARHADVPKIYVEALRNTMDGPRRGRDQAREAGWEMVGIDGGHDLPVTHPAATAAVLHDLATRA